MMPTTKECECPHRRVVESAPVGMAVCASVCSFPTPFLLFTYSQKSRLSFSSTIWNHRQFHWQKRTPWFGRPKWSHERRQRYSVRWSCTCTTCTSYYLRTFSIGIVADSLTSSCVPAVKRLTEILNPDANVEASTNSTCDNKDTSLHKFRSQTMVLATSASAPVSFTGT